MRRGLVISLVLSFALVTAPIEAATRGAGQFVLRCRYSHTLPDDPIVTPGQHGASHSHDFFGNVTADADSTIESMLAGDTTCRVPSDTAGYWTPTAYLNGQPIRPTVMRIYYLGTANADVQTIPPGLEVVGGNKMAASEEENPQVRWSCGETKSVKTPRLPRPYDCTSWAERYPFVDGVIAVVDLPNCWDGAGLTPEHLNYPIGGECPTPFRTTLPRLSERVHYGIMNPTNADGSIALTLSSGPYWSYHADFWNTWQQPRLDQLVEQCIVAGVRCGAADVAEQVAWTTQFGTSRYDLAYAAATDGAGVYVAGFTNYALAGQRYHRRYDAFVRKYDADGNVLWTRQFGTSGTDQALGVAADEGGVTVVGSTDGRLPGQEATGGTDAFIARFGPNGNQQWIRQFGTRGNDRATAVATGGADAFVVGTTEGSLGKRRGGPDDAFLVRVDESGDLEWIRQFGTRGSDEAAGVTVRSGTAHVVGSTTGHLRSVFLGGTSDGFVSIFDSSGTFQGWRQVGTAGTDRLTGAVARADGLFVSGTTDGSLPEQAASGGLDAFAAKLNLDGRGIWFRQFGSAADDQAVAIGADRKGVYVAGSASGAIPNGELLGEWDAFVRKYLPNGTELWTEQLGTPDYDFAYALAVERTGLFLAGTTHGAFEGQLNAGDRDVFVVRVAFS